MLGGEGEDEDSDIGRETRAASRVAKIKAMGRQQLGTARRARVARSHEVHEHREDQERYKALDDEGQPETEKNRGASLANAEGSGAQSPPGSDLSYASAWVLNRAHVGKDVEQHGDEDMRVKRAKPKRCTGNTR